ncbi:uncharacterized protein K452DRAFT_171378 [Aplosporella prunicola CBS 121167]|uniref:Uncharacterized protein n=1 Tax=Aplosporella prunicola CBS 121167 TaxID=1176127 RepID=A0A6A6BHI4_9PEZI|nr:uncharacterized protein K452DRAFT_171378 [Aplosporella prunicola CBS 121167]KAF2143456.1 hypothetical protein K452DRAFT_171378 [Aplosporella prunicola CBS 121167]
MAVWHLMEHLDDRPSNVMVPAHSSIRGFSFANDPYKEFELQSRQARGSFTASVAASTIPIPRNKTTPPPQSSGPRPVARGPAATRRRKRQDTPHQQYPSHPQSPLYTALDHPRSFAACYNAPSRPTTPYTRTPSPERKSCMPRNHVTE